MRYFYIFLIFLFVSCSIGKKSSKTPKYKSIVSENVDSFPKKNLEFKEEYNLENARSISSKKMEILKMKF
jgi:predicted AlkP superfamily pyrophosphatase or phosphodiesterase